MGITLAITYHDPAGRLTPLAERVVPILAHIFDNVVFRLPGADWTILGRTPAAFASHPAVQRDTEALVNRMFGAITGLPWDVTAAARGLSRRAVDALVAGCPDNAISVDVSWPLHLWRAGSFTLAYRSVDGLAFETPDRFAPEIAAAGGHAPWLAQLDADPRHWARRLELARVMMTAMEPYAPRTAGS
jgi:hypothetical protein